MTIFYVKNKFLKYFYRHITFQLLTANILFQAIIDSVIEIENQQIKKLDFCFVWCGQLSQSLLRFFPDDVGSY